MRGYQDYLYPCLFSEEKSIFNYTPAAVPLTTLRKLYTDIERIKVINESIRIALKVSELIL